MLENTFSVCNGSFKIFFYLLDILQYKTFLEFVMLQKNSVLISSFLDTLCFIFYQNPFEEFFI